jgi:protein TonB
MKVGAFGIPFISSLVIHGLMIMLGSFLIHSSDLRRAEFLPIKLVDLPRLEHSLPVKKIEVPPEIKKPPPPAAPKVDKPKTPPAIAKAPIVKSEPAAPLPPASLEEEAPKAAKVKTAEPAKTEPAPSFASGARAEGGGSEAGAENLFGKGDVGVVAGSGTSGGGGGTAVSGLGRGSGAPGLPAQTAPIKTNREAKPIQTVRASYPAMALRMGMESDVTLKIIVDSEGKVSKAEILKTGGAGFDEEALKAVKQSRFEPAQREGRNVTAEFTYIYRFRLRK